METIKYLAFVFMIIDHVGWLYFPDNMDFRIVGRLAVPLFCYFIAFGFSQTTNLNNYVLRLLKWGVVTQIILWSFNFEIYPQLNVLFTFAWSLIALALLQKNNQPKDQIIILGIFALLSEVFYFEYGFYAILSVYLFSLFEKIPQYRWWLYWTLLNCIYFMFSPLSVFQLFAWFAPFLIPIKNQTKLKLPRLGWRWYPLYPLQYLLLLSIYFIF